MDDLKRIVAKNIIYLRTSHKMTQLELGEAISYSDKSVSKWERGEALPDAFVLKELSKLFNVPVDYLLHEHDEKDLKPVKAQLYDKRIISLVSFLGTWTLALIIFAVFWFLGSMYWIIFAYALPASLIVMIVLTAVWGKSKTNIFFVSLLIWSIIAAVYLTFLQYNWWLLFVIGIPAQIITVLAFYIKRTPKSK